MNTDNINNSVCSRCGLDCNACENREKCDCPGCPELEEGNWAGDCEVKLCCEKKNFEHCGICPDFPCELLRNTAFDTEEGDDGERLITLKRWAEESTAKKERIRSRVLTGLCCGTAAGAVLGAVSGSFAAVMFACMLVGTAIGVMVNIMKGDK